MTTKKKSSSKKSARSTKTTTKSSSKTMSAEDIRVLIRDTTLKIIQEQNLKLEDLSLIAEEVIASTAAGLKEALPSSRQSALHQVVMGLSDAWAVTAETSEATVRHAKRYGLAFAKKDLGNLTDQLKDLEKLFFKTVSDTAGRLQGDASEELRNVAARIKKAGTDIKPAADRAQKAVTLHMKELAEEVATTGIKVGKKAVGAALLGATGFLEGVSKSITGTKKPNKSKR